jgi:hypothetical protein
MSSQPSTMLRSLRAKSSVFTNRNENKQPPPTILTISGIKKVTPSEAVSKKLKIKSKMELKIAQERTH